MGCMYQFVELDPKIKKIYKYAKKETIKKKVIKNFKRKITPKTSKK